MAELAWALAVIPVAAAKPVAPTPARKLRRPISLDIIGVLLWITLQIVDAFVCNGCTVSD
jgi:hypothetical protein